jgi:dihydropteroate synthase
MFTIQAKGKLYMFDNPVVMGILNITPDSFFEGSRAINLNAAIEKVGQDIAYGMRILDVGGQSTRPGSERVGAQEELDRIIPYIEVISQHFPELIISVDTYHAKVAEVAFNTGAHIINDISSGRLDPNMISTVAKLQAPYIIMHMQGTPETMQQNPTYKDVTVEVIQELASSIQTCIEAGIKDIIIDPGFGFGKNMEHNYTLLRQLPAFHALNKPILVGVSRKRMIYGLLGSDAKHALNGTTIVNTIALMNGAQLLRVHDVKEACEAVKIFTFYKATKPSN